MDPVHCGCDLDATCGLMPVDEALALGLSFAQPPVVTERLALREATGRVLAQPGRAKPPLPASGAATWPSQDAEILSARRVIGPRETGVLAAKGQEQFVVRRRIEVALLTTSSDPADADVSLAPRPISDANRFTLAAQLPAAWIRLHDFGAAPDDPVRHLRILTVAADLADLIVTVGGVSVGGEDLLPRLVREAGGTIHVTSIAVTPGGSLTIGEIGGAIWIGLPGNLVAAFVGWTVIGARIIESVAGAASCNTAGS